MSLKRILILVKANIIRTQPTIIPPTINTPILQRVTLTSPTIIMIATITMTTLMQPGYAASIPMCTTIVTMPPTIPTATGMTTIHTVGGPAFIWATTGGTQVLACPTAGDILLTEGTLIGIPTTDGGIHTDTDTVIITMAIGMVIGMDIIREMDIITTVTIITQLTTVTVILV